MANCQNLISRELCTRCGACFVADNQKILSKDELGFPVVSKDASQEDVKGLLKVCSGEDWNYRELLTKVHGAGVDYKPDRADIGHHIAIRLVTSTDAVARERGQSGGVSTTLLRFAMRENFIESAVVVRRPKGLGSNPFSSEPYLASSEAELDAAAGSKYTICSTLEILKELQVSRKNFAISTLPCQTVGFWKLVDQHDPTLIDRCKLIIGPYCGYNMEVLAAKELAAAQKIETSKVVSFSNREGHFPGETTYTMATGEKKLIDRTAHRLLYRMYTPVRCLTCTDYGNELADLSIADCWEQDGDKFRHPEGAAFVVVRTQRGKEFLDRALAAGVIKTMRSQEEDQKDDAKRWELSFFHRKVRAHNRILYFKKKNVPVPIPDYPMPPQFKPAAVADWIELTSWQIFRNRLARKCALKIWLWLANSPKNSFPNYVFQECKAYLFTHHHDQFSKKYIKLSAKRFLKLVRKK